MFPRRLCVFGFLCFFPLQYLHLPLDNEIPLRDQFLPSPYLSNLVYWQADKGSGSKKSLIPLFIPPSDILIAKVATVAATTGTLLLALPPSSLMQYFSLLELRICIK